MQPRAARAGRCCTRRGEARGYGVFSHLRPHIRAGTFLHAYLSISWLEAVSRIDMTAATRSRHPLTAAQAVTGLPVARGAGQLTAITAGA